ncbi:hypothetical protein EDD11_008787 [Mortierella claussenii]|nr:hypothetical protein EDD11_008787 [Mortierella claussenii]
MHLSTPSCGLHIAQALAGLSLEQICSCDDDQDSEHSWATITSPTAAASSKRAIPRYPLPYPAASPTSAASGSTPSSAPLVTGGAKSFTSAVDLTDTCADVPSPVEYKLSKISTTSAAEAAMRKAKQAAALEELRRIKEQKDKELKSANEDAFQRLLKGLSQADDKLDGGSNSTTE